MDGAPCWQRTVPVSRLAAPARRARARARIAPARGSPGRTPAACAVRSAGWWRWLPWLAWLGWVAPVFAAPGDAGSAWPRLQSLSMEDGLPSDTVQALAQDRHGLLWIGTRTGLAVYDGREVSVWAPGLDALPPGQDVRRLESLPDGRLRVGLADGPSGWLSADRLAFRRGDEAPSTGPRPQPRLRDRRGTLWLGGPDGLRSRVPGGPWRNWSGHPQLRGAVTALLEDHEGGVWIAQDEGALHRLPASAAAFEERPAPTGPGCPWRPAGVASAGGDALWVASGACLWRVALADGAATPVRLPGAAPGEPLRGLVGDGRDGLWLMLDEAVLHRAADTGRWHRWPVPAPRQLVPLAEGAWVLGADGRPAWLDPGVPRRVHVDAWPDAATRSPSAAAPVQPLVRRLLAGPAGEPWAVTDAGLWRRGPAGWIRLGPVPGLPQDVQAQGDQLWWLDATGLRAVRLVGDRLQAGPLAAAAPAPGAGARLIAAGEALPGLLSPRGLALPAGEAGWRRYGPRDGLAGRPADGAVAWLPARRAWAWATGDGLQLASPESLPAPDRDEDRMHLSLQVVRGDALVELASGPGLARMLAGDRDLRIRLRRVSFSEPAGYRFRAWIDGVDPGPVELGPSGLRLVPALAPGQHRLLLASARGGEAWGEPQVVTLLVDPPWWRTREFNLVLATGGLALAGLLLAGLRVLLRRRTAWRLLEQRRRNAERVSDAKTRFLAMLAHEIRTPLTGVLGMAELLLHDELAPAQRARVQALQSAGRHLVRLVNDALDLARIESGRLALEQAPFDLPALLREVATLLQPLARERSLGFALRLAPGLPERVLGDATRLRQVLLNLGHNAIKFCDQGGLGLDAAPADGGGIVLSVRDTGPGLSDGQRARLFRRFEAGAGSRGAGLGLAISQELAQAMGGSLRVESSPGEGAAFVLALPLPAAPPADGAAGQPGADEPVDASTPAAGARRVLLVEDDPLVAEVVCALLARAGHLPTHAPHALAALAERATGTHDLLLLDLDLPGMDGLALSRLLQGRGDPVPRVALTARADPAAEPAARAAGMVGFLRKPVDGEALADAVRRWSSAQE